MQGLGFREILRAEFLRRFQSNPRYSLRAFARDMDYDVSSLSKILKGKKTLGPRVIRRIGARMGIEKPKLERFVVEEKISSARGMLEENRFHELSLDVFQIISDWYHFAILELIYVKGFQPRPAWVAKRLGIRLLEAERAVSRLKRAGLLVVGPKGEWAEANGDRLTTTGIGGTAAAFQNMQRQLLALASRAQDKLSRDVRDQSSMTMAIDTRKLSIAKEKIKTFRRELSQLLTRTDERDEVYALTISLFPLSKKGAG